jgi:hypothetical protein
MGLRQKYSRSAHTETHPPFLQSAHKDAVHPSLSIDNHHVGAHYLSAEMICQKKRINVAIWVPVPSRPNISQLFYFSTALRDMKCDTIGIAKMFGVRCSQLRSILTFRANGEIPIPSHLSVDCIYR